MFQTLCSAARASSVLVISPFARRVSTASAIQRGVGRSIATANYIHKDNRSPRKTSEPGIAFKQRRKRRSQEAPARTAGFQSRTWPRRSDSRTAPVRKALNQASDPATRPRRHLEAKTASRSQPGRWWDREAPVVHAQSDESRTRPRLDPRAIPVDEDSLTRRNGSAQHSKANVRMGIPRSARATPIGPKFPLLRERSAQSSQASGRPGTLRSSSRIPTKQYISPRQDRSVLLSNRDVLDPSLLGSATSNSSTKNNIYGSLDSKFRESRERAPVVSVPYTAPASEFLYGRSVVEAALKAGRRKLYKLYFNNTEKTGTSRLIADEPLIRLAHAKGVEVKSLRREDAGRLLDAMSRGRPHNGIVLEASPLPKLPCLSLGEINSERGYFTIDRARQSHEDYEVNGNNTDVSFDAAEKRLPFLLLLDGILDPGNLGAILRSAFFLGVDAVILSSHGAPLTSAALKASAGAAELLPVLSTHNTGNFIRMSQKFGWRFYAAVPLRDELALPPKPTFSLRSLNSPLQNDPCVVMLGGEGTGLWKDLQYKADRFVSIHGPRAGQAGVDSLNVSVSAALLTEAFLRPWPTQRLANRLWDLN